MFSVLKERESSCESVALRWDTNHRTLNILLVDKATGIAYANDVAPEKANDAFEHPFIYATDTTQERSRADVDPHC